jgi:hypothetical protein
MYYSTSIILILSLTLIKLYEISMSTVKPAVKSTVKSSRSIAYSSEAVTPKAYLANSDPTSDPTLAPTSDPSSKPSFDIYPHANDRSLCINSNGTTIYGPSNCTSGEVMLLGNYVNLGIHNVASFGTESEYQSSYFKGQLGYIADFDQKGWLDTEGNPRYAGDYVIPGAPLEGMYTSSSSST